jgi:alpha-tubulin suppressor-like RCC1 family protein
VDSGGRLLSCGEGAAVGHGATEVKYFLPTLVTAMAGVRVRSVAAGKSHSLALTWEGRVYSWGGNENGQLGHGIFDYEARFFPTLVEGLEGVRGIAAAFDRSFAVTQSGDSPDCVTAKLRSPFGAVLSWIR